MTPELWERLNPLFLQAVERQPEERDAFIAEVCGTDSELRAELAALVAAHSQQEATAENVDVIARRLIATAAHATLGVGDLLLGRFRIVRHVGSGGMGDVYEAFDGELSHPVALKLIRSEIIQDDTLLARFKKEVQLARRLTGPHVCRIHEFFVLRGRDSNNNGAFLTMELLDGVTLADRLKRGPLPQAEAEAVAVDICMGLCAIHGAGIVHRDLKTRNIMLAKRDGYSRAVLMDFGLARDLSPAKSTDETGLTLPGAFVGTPAYMAPEQFEGTAVTPATDIYALGIVLYELSTGKHPFASTSAMGAAVRRARAPEPASSLNRMVPRRWDEVIRKCLQYEPSNRFQSAGEIAKALRRSRLPFPLASTNESPTLLRRSAWLALAAILAIAAVFVWRRSTDYRPPNPRALQWYVEGTAALREGAYLQAANELQNAVKLDPHFGVAHARLADAWAELDFTKSAEEEMLLASAPEREKNIPVLDRNYIEAVRATLTHDLGTAVRYYTTILSELPRNQQGYGYVDLGRAQEKAGDIADALKSYETAAKLNPDNPAPFVHLGILKSRHQDPDGAEAAFHQADDLYRLKGNLEGRAEVAFQRGHSANERSQPALARKYLDSCLELARQIGSVQLEVRALTQISNVEYRTKQEDQAIKDADRAIQLAKENQLEYWATDALIRKATAYLMKGDLTNAEENAQQALREATSNQHAHLVANAQVTLASIYDMREVRDPQIELANAALQYFNTYGFMGQASGATNLIIRGEWGMGDYAKAIQAGSEFLAAARKVNSPADIEAADETLGGILVNLERYPEALPRFQEALAVSTSQKEDTSYQALHCTEVFWHLGRYGEAEAMLTSIPPQGANHPDVKSGIALAKAEIRLSQRRFGEAYQIASNSLKTFSDLPPGKLYRFRQVEARSENESGRTRKALEDAQALLNEARKQQDDWTIADASRLVATICVKDCQPDQISAESAAKYFHDKQQPESEWLTLACLARLYQRQKDMGLAEASAKKALDIVSSFQHTWSSPAFQLYSSRPDIHQALADLSRLRQD